MHLQAVKFIQENLATSTEKLGKDVLLNCAKTAMSSKIIGSDSDFFAQIVVDSIQAVKTTKADGKVVYPVKAINVLKAHGRSAHESCVLNGYALNMGRASQVSPVSTEGLPTYGLLFHTGLRAHTGRPSRPLQRE